MESESAQENVDSVNGGTSHPSHRCPWVVSDFFSAEAEQAEELYFTYLFNVSSADREAGDAFQKCLITHSPWTSAIASGNQVWLAGKSRKIMENLLFMDYCVI